MDSVDTADALMGKRLVAFLPSGETVTGKVTSTAHPNFTLETDGGNQYVLSIYQVSVKIKNGGDKFNVRREEGGNERG